MSGTGTSLGEAENLNEQASKREQRKLEHALKLIQASEISQSKCHKRRRQNNEVKKDPSARKLIKENKSKDTTETLSRQISNKQSKAEKFLKKRDVKELHNFYNKKYGISQDKTSFQEHLLNYSYEQKSALAEKQCQDWDVIQKLQGAKLRCSMNQNQKNLTDMINSEFQKGPEKIKIPFSKSYNEFVKKFVGPTK